MKKDSKSIDTFLVAIFIVAVSLLVFQNVDGMTGHATEGSTYSNVTIQKYLAINFGGQLGNGIYFGNVATLPATNINATENYNGTNNATNYYLNVSTDSNTHVDFCILANAGLTSAAADVIGLGNETYSTNYTSSNMTLPPLSAETAMTTNYTKAATDVAPGNSSYWRFWLDIPAAQPSGDYNNTVSFKGVTATQAC